MSFFEKNYFLLRKLQVLTGLLPVGIFLLVHLSINSYALKGPESFNAAAGFMEQLPFVGFMEIFIIAVPILFHGLYGLWIVYIARNNTSKYGHYRNWAFYLQRISALITFVFLVYHVYTTRMAKLLYGTEINFNLMASELANPAILGFYIVGVIASMYHFANGLWGLLIDMGITIGPRSQKVVTYVTSALFIVLSVLSIQILLAFRA
ncbi:succinate dehydrogenase / fumarate reductase cytochrome b subunit [Desulfitispora alkaliphila]|uniref:succinate dehydrogenase n=1 Tax=Desulfitispora alkaliphila TaxID=622674 RepID=UPI003D231A6D